MVSVCQYLLTFSFVFPLQYVKIKRAPALSTDALCVRRRTMRGHGKTAPSTVASVQVQTAPWFVIVSNEHVTNYHQYSEISN